MLYVIIAVLSMLFFAVACGWLAGEKGRDTTSWVILGLLFGVFAFMLLGFSPNKQIAASKTEDTANNSDERSQLPAGFFKCPACGKAVADDWRECSHCGELLFSDMT